jgi:hypothetical protein
VKARLLPLSIFILGCFVASAEEKEIIKDKSPDGKFAVRVKETDSGSSAQVIELSTKRAVIDLGETGNAEEVNLVWSVDSRHAAFSNGNTGVSGVYFRDGDQFREVALPDFPTCGEAKDQDPKNLSTVYLPPKPTYWVSSNVLALTISGEWKTPEGKYLSCDDDATVVFKAEGKAKIDKIEPPKEAITGIESPKGTFFVEELELPVKDDEGHPDTDLEVWIVSAKDPARREPLPGFHEKGFTHLNSVSISPDENWMLVARHYGSHMNATYLFHRKDGLKFEDVFPDVSFDNEAWKFLCKIEKIPKSKIDATDDFPGQAGILEWSDDSARLLIDLHGGLTGKDTYYRLADFKKPGVSGWGAYYNTKTKKFELTDRLRKNNKGARQRWKAMDNDNEEAPEDGFVPPSAESVGHEGSEAPVAERLKKYEAELAALVKHRESQLEGVDRAEFQQKQKDWREELENKAAKIKDPQKRLGFRTRSTWYHLIDVREERLPVYEEPKSPAEK